MTNWGTTAGTLQGALANIINECELPSSREMPLTALASVAAYARDVLARTAEPVRERYIIGPDGAAYGPFAPRVPTGTGWPVA